MVNSDVALTGHDEFDVLIIGAGQAGIPLARRLANEKLRVGLAERKFLGGSCVNFGCTPTKAVLASARVAHLARRAAEFGVKVSGVEVDLPAVLARARGIVAESREGLQAGLDKTAVHVLHGHARFSGRAGERFRLTVGDRTVTAARVVIDTGTRTDIPPIDGLADVDYLHADNWLERDVRPASLLIVGAGYIGLEMAQFYRRVGMPVTVIDPGDRIAGREDPDVAAGLQTLLEAEGIAFRLGTRATAVRRDSDGIRLTLDRGEAMSASHLFIATGRLANTDALGLDTIGLTPRKDGILDVDERLSTNVAGVWACGDVRGGPMFTHSSWDDHRVLESQLIGDGRRTTAGRIVPYAIFTDPELGRVGLTETQARREFGDAIRVARFDMKHNGKANQQGEPAGFIKLVADLKTRRLLGAAVLAADGAELVAIYVTMMNSGVDLSAICRGIYIHPTLSEAAQSAVAMLDLGLPSRNALG